MAIKPILFNSEMVRAILDGRKSCTRRIIKPQPTAHYGTQCVIPPYKPGDILYVRETWCGLPVNEAGHFRGHPIYYYKADGDLRPEGWRGAWHPSIHMLKEAARIWMKVTDVRVERLQDIDGKGCLKEGIEEEPLKYVGDEFVKGMFHDLWDSTIKKSDLDRYGWDANPYVFVIEFLKIDKPEEV